MSRAARIQRMSPDAKDAFGWILTSFSVFSLVIGLSLQDILKNFFAGIWVLVERPFRIGDTIVVTGARSSSRTPCS